MIINGKRGLSPVIATVLLVSLALVLAVVVFLWARSFVGESIIKNERDIALSCDEVSFKAEAYNNRIFIENSGRVPIYGIEILRKRTIGEIKEVAVFDENQGGVSLYSGESDDVDISGLISDGTLEVGDLVSVVPILLGESERYKKAHVCSEGFAEEILIEA